MISPTVFDGHTCPPQVQRVRLLLAGDSISSQPDCSQAAPLMRISIGQ